MLQSMASFYFVHIGVVWIDIVVFWFGYGCWFTVGPFANCGGLVMCCGFTFLQLCSALWVVLIDTCTPCRWILTA